MSLRRRGVSAAQDSDESATVKNELRRSTRPLIAFTIARSSRQVGVVTLLDAHTDEKPGWSWTRWSRGVRRSDIHVDVKGAESEA